MGRMDNVREENQFMEFASGGMKAYDNLAAANPDDASILVYSILAASLARCMNIVIHGGDSNDFHADDNPLVNHANVTIRYYYSGRNA